MKKLDITIKNGDMIGQRVVISEEFKKNKHTFHKVQCSCGQINDVKLSALKMGIKNKTHLMCKGCANKARRYQIEEKRSGRLVAKKYMGNEGEHRFYWECLCDCGNICYCFAADIVKKKRTSCGCGKVKDGDQNPAWKGCGVIPKSVWTCCRHNALTRELEFDISIEYLEELFIKQNGRCALTGREIFFKSKNQSKTASIDRIDSFKGYTKDNIQWVDKNINNIKMNYSEKDFIEMCCIVADYHRENNINHNILTDDV